MSLTSKERQILEQGGFKVHKYADGYVELTHSKTGMVLAYDALNETAYEGLKDFKGWSPIDNVLLHLKLLKKG